MIGPREFLELLWGPAPPGLIQIWQLRGKRSSYYRAPAGTTGLKGRTDVYACVALSHKDHGRTHRAKANEAIAIAGLWLDLDVNGGPDHKTGAIPTITDALEVAGLHAAPTLTVSSGYGLHAWYLLDQPWRFASRDEQQAAARASAQWYQLHRTAISERGWGLDHAHDLARLLRLPGTLNGKGGQQRPVTVPHTNGPRYTRAQLLALAAQAGDITLTTGQQQPDEAAMEISVPHDLQRPMILDALLANIPEFAAAWNHQGGPRTIGWSLSEYDMSIAAIAAQAPGVTDQQLAELIVYHRLSHDPADRKARRLDYLRRTIGKVRAPSPREQALELLRSRPTQTPVRRAA